MIRPTFAHLVAEHRLTDAAHSSTIIKETTIYIFSIAICTKRSLRFFCAVGVVETTCSFVARWRPARVGDLMKPSNHLSMA